MNEQPTPDWISEAANEIVCSEFYNLGREYLVSKTSTIILTSYEKAHPKIEGLEGAVGKAVEQLRFYGHLRSAFEHSRQLILDAITPLFETLQRTASFYEEKSRDREQLKHDRDRLADQIDAMRKHALRKEKRQ